MHERVWIYTLALALIICAAFIRVFSSYTAVTVMSGQNESSDYGITLSDLAENCFAKSFAN